MPKTTNKPFELPSGLYYDATFASGEERDSLLHWLCSLTPVWESRYSQNHPPPSGEQQRQLLRPVYWLGNWQFACLNYYRPPHRVKDCCVRAEPFSPILQKMVDRMEAVTRRTFAARDIPKGWHLNTCLVNYYGNRWDGERWLDTARVGDHKDYEPGPVASLSFGERAFFQFVSSYRKGQRHSVVFQQWLEDGSLQMFAGPRWKDELFHRVQRVEKKRGHYFPVSVERFQVRRINLTLRFVPEAHIQTVQQLPRGTAQDVEPYLRELAKNSSFFRQEVQAWNQLAWNQRTF